MTNSRLQNYTVFYDNSEEYHNLKREIFTSDLYYFETDNPTPFIIDAGAHIGLSTLYFKQMYPDSKILCVEPNPRNFELLKQNLFENQIENVQTLQVALSDTDGKAELFFDKTPEQWYSTSGLHKGSWAGVQDSEKIIVDTITLSEIITKPIDFLKIDIEGVEQKVLQQAQSKLKMVKEIHLEYHSHPTQSLQKLIDLLNHTHKVEVYQGSNIIIPKRIKKVIGLAQIRATRR